jgi:N-methylhydantoinase B
MSPVNATDTVPSAATLSIFRHLLASAAEEMGVTLGRAAYSPNIKERLDFSCAVFLGDGRMLAQAAHIPVHLGAMPASVKTAIRECAPFQAGDVVILNDPYLGGNHLPDITLVSPVFITQETTGGNSARVTPSTGANSEGSESGGDEPPFFVASRAHHADVGGMSPGSMPLSTELYQEGIIIPPVKLLAAGQRNEAVWRLILRNVRTPVERAGDLAAQLAAHAIGAQRLQEIVDRYGLEETIKNGLELIDYAARLTRAAVAQIPEGRYSFRDFLDGDGQSDDPLPIQATVTVRQEEMIVDFGGTAGAVRGNINAVPAIVESAVAYCLRCVAMKLLETNLPMNQGAFEPIRCVIQPGSLLDPYPPHAVAAGNVETSQRVVDVVFGALAQAMPSIIPAASQGTMNNLTFGGTTPGGVSGEYALAVPAVTHVEPQLAPRRQPEPFAYYETIGGGAGAGPGGPGASGIHVHMSNTLNTPVEALEYSFPLRVVEYSLRHGSGGRGKHQGGEGLVRRIQFLSPVTATIVSERRVLPPYGLNGGSPGANGRNSLERDGQIIELRGKTTLELKSGDLLSIETPGGGGWGCANPGEREEAT